MDPLSIAAGATGLAMTCLKVTGCLYGFIDDTKQVDTNLSDLCDEIVGLSRVLNGISKSWKQHNGDFIANDPSGDLWLSVRATLDDCKGTLGKLETKLDEIQGSGFFNRGFLKRPTRQIRLNLRIKDISLYRQRIHSYSNAMSGAMQMINVCLLLQSNASQDAISSVLAGLKVQLGRVEDSLHVSDDADSSTDLREDQVRIRNNMQHLVSAAEVFHSSASTVITGDRSTVWAGSVAGEILDNEEMRRIERWIPPVEELDETTGSTASAVHDASDTSTSLGNNTPRSHSTTQQHIPLQPDSDSDLDFENDLIDKFEELSITQIKLGNYVKAAEYMREVTKRLPGGTDGSASARRQTALVKYALVLFAAGEYEAAEEIIMPIASSRTCAEVALYECLHALALTLAQNKAYGAAIKLAKRALTGKRRLMGKDAVRTWLTLRLLESLYRSAGDETAADGCRALLPDDSAISVHYDTKVALDHLQHNTGEIIPWPKTIKSDVSAQQERPRSASELTQDGVSSQFITYIPGVTSSQSPSNRFLAPINATASIGAPQQVPFGSKPLPSPPEGSRSIDLSRPEQNRPSIEMGDSSRRSLVQDALGSQGSPRDLLTNGAKRMVVLGPSETLRLATEQHERDTLQRRQDEPSSSSQLAAHRGGRESQLVTPAARSGARLFVAIDFGLDQSAVVWCYVDGTYAKEELVTNWRGDNVSSVNVPSRVYYDQLRQVVGWGYEVSGALKPNGQLKDNVKCEECFRVPFQGDDQSDIKLPSWALVISRQQVGVHFLTKVREKLALALKDKGIASDITPAVSMTVPRLDSTPVSMGRLESMAVNAGITTRTHPTSFLLVDETEAIATHAYVAGVMPVALGDKVCVLSADKSCVFIDCVKLESNSPLRFAMDWKTPPTDTCGSKIVTEAFRELLRSKIKRMNLPEGSRTAIKVFVKNVAEFENRIMKEFNGAVQQKWAVDVGLEAEYPEADIQEGYMIHTYQEIKACFDPVMREIAEELWEPIRDTDPKFVIITGTLASCVYLLQSLRKDWPRYASRLITPPDAETAAVRGTLAAGMVHFHQYRTPG